MKFLKKKKKKVKKGIKIEEEIYGGMEYGTKHTQKKKTTTRRIVPAPNQSEEYY